MCKCNFTAGAFLSIVILNAFHSWLLVFVDILLVKPSPLWLTFQRWSLQLLPTLLLRAAYKLNLASFNVIFHNCKVFCVYIYEHQHSIPPRGFTRTHILFWIGIYCVCVWQVAHATLEVFKSKFYYTDDDDLVLAMNGSWELTDKVDVIFSLTNSNSVWVWPNNILKNTRSNSVWVWQNTIVKNTVVFFAWTPEACPNPDSPTASLYSLAK